MEYISEIITGAIGFFAGGFGTWLRTKAANNQTNSTEKVELVKELARRVEVLETHNEEQDNKIHELVVENAKLQAQNTVLLEQNSALKTEISNLKEELKEWQQRT